ncbi:hypothetical protein HNQ77_004227 [Silvibacterium bohemicum]|uniref:Uncharacterized protein n=1 Tax=Silvibacterium bohemicum TaxID=1577686 RepID=A0A841K000_9BACT|nr:hypothetical protein [Silvibacterium bohemicum]
MCSEGIDPHRTDNDKASRTGWLYRCSTHQPEGMHHRNHSGDCPKMTAL